MELKRQVGKLEKKTELAQFFSASVGKKGMRMLLASIVEIVFDIDDFRKYYSSYDLKNSFEQQSKKLEACLFNE